MRRNKHNANRPWMSATLLCIRNKRRTAGRRAATTKHPADKQIYAAVSDEYAERNQQDYIDYVQRKGAKLMTNPKRFWSFVDSNPLGKR